MHPRRIMVARGAAAWLLSCVLSCEGAAAPEQSGDTAGAVALTSQALTSAPAGTVTYEYDAARRLRRVGYAGGAERRYTLDAAGNRVKVETDQRAGTLAFEPQGYRTRYTEDETFPIPVARKDGSNGPASVDCVGVGRSATAGVDFTVLSSRLTWADGDSEPKSCFAKVNFNPQIEGREQFELQLQNASGAKLGAPASLLIDVDDLYTVDRTPPTVPTGVTATLTGDSTARITWQPSTDPIVEPEVITLLEGYYVYRNGVQVATVYVPTLLEYRDSGLQPATTYRYTVAAFDQGGNVSAQSAAAAVVTLDADDLGPTPPKPVNAVLLGPSSVKITWGPSTDPKVGSEVSTGLAGYIVQRDSVVLLTLRTSAGASPPPLEYVDNGPLTPGTRYGYSVTAFDQAGNVSQTLGAEVVTPGAAPTADTTPPTAPSFVNAVGVAGYKIKITWGESFDPIVSGQLRSALMGYQVQRDGLALCNVILDFGETLECFDDGLPMGTAYYYTVVAFDYAGNRSPVAGPVQARTLGPTEGPPFPPQVPGVLVGSYFTGLAASCPAGAMCAQPGGIPLTWTQVSIVTRYQIEQSFVDYTTNPPGATPFVVIGETTGLAFTVPESQRGGYGETYRVRSCSNTGCGFYSQEASFVLPITFPDPGGTPF